MIDCNRPVLLILELVQPLGSFSPATRRKSTVALAREVQYYQALLDLRSKKANSMNYWSVGKLSFFFFEKENYPGVDSLFQPGDWAISSAEKAREGL